MMQRIDTARIVITNADDIIAGWESRAAYYRSHAYTLGMSPRDTQNMLALADAATLQARKAAAKARRVGALVS